MKELQADVTVVGTGITGLWTAKELVDDGYTVNMVEKGRYLAGGATTRNEGWLHGGAYHAAILEDEETALAVAEKIQRGSRAIRQFAPESIAPQETYALLGRGHMALRAMARWEDAGVVYESVGDTTVFGGSDGIDVREVTEIYKVEDKSVNTRLLCQRLAGYIIEYGGNIFTEARFEPVDENSADLLISGDNKHSLRSDQFVIAAGSGIKELSEKVVGVGKLAMSFFKAHLLIFPRLTKHNYFSIDSYGVNFMNHNGASIAGLNLDSTQVAMPDYVVVNGKDQLIFEAVTRLIPGAMNYMHRTQCLACIKPGIQREGMPNRPGIDEEILTLSESYLCALPGKMTEAPHLAQAIAAHLESIGIRPRGFLATSRRRQRGVEHMRTPDVALRPIDRWLGNPFA